MSKRFAIEYTKKMSYVGYIKAENWREAQTRFFNEGPVILEDHYISGSDITLYSVEDAPEDDE